MAYPNLQQWQYIELTMKDKLTGTSSTYYLSNRAIIDDTNVGRYVPILQEIGNLGASLGSFIPDAVSSTITLDDSPGSYGYERRFSDLLERQTPIEQTIKIYVAQTELDDLNVTADFTLAWQGVVVSLDLSRGEGPSVSLQVSSVSIPVRDIGKLVTEREFTTAPTQSLGEVIPLVIGAGVECRPLLIDAEDDTSPRYAYCVTMGTDYPVSGVTNYFAKDTQGVFREFVSASNASTAVISYTTGTPGGGSTPQIESGLVVGSGAYVVVQGRVKFEGTGAGGWTPAATSKIFFRLYTRDAISGVPASQVGYGEVLKSTHQTSFRGGTAFFIDFDFTESVPLISPNGYILTVSQTSNATAGTGTGDAVQVTVDTANTGAAYYRLSSSTTVETVDNGWYYEAASTKLWYYDLYAAKFTDNPAGTATVDSETGYGHAYVEITQKTPTGTPCNLTNLDMLFRVSGIKDNGSGTCTGSASSLIESPVHAIKLLDKEWNSTIWTGGKFDFTRYSSSHTEVTTTTSTYYRKIAGSTRGRTLLSDLYEEICRAGVLRITLFNGGASRLGLLAWGVINTASVTISDEDATIQGVRVLGTQTVVNRATFSYKPTYFYVDPRVIATSNRLSGFSANVDWYNGVSAYVTALVSTSVSLYGTRPLRDREYSWIRDQDSAELVADFLLRVYQHPHVYVELEAPFYKYSSVDMLDVVNIVHPDLPAYFGTSSNATLPFYSGSAVDINEGNYWKRAKPYRAQIEGREIFFDRDNIPKIRFTARLLINPNDPT